jgi:hypothetical protein
MGFIPKLVQIQILQYLYDNKKDLILKSVSIGDLVTAFETDEGLITFNYNVVRAGIYELVDVGLIADGVKVGNTYTYYITENGKKYLSLATGTANRKGSK